MLPTGLIGVNYMAGFNLKNLITSLDKMEKIIQMMNSVKCKTKIVYC